MMASPQPTAATCRGIAVSEAADFFRAHSSAQERRLFTAGIDDLCDRAFGVFSGNALIGVATTRFSKDYWSKLSSSLERAGKETLLGSLQRISIYDPTHLAPLPETSLRQLYRQIAWVAVGGERGWSGEPYGTELFGRFIMERCRGRGYGLQLLDHVLTTLEAEKTLPLRAMPSSNNNRTYGGRADGRRLVVLNSRYFQSKLAR